MYIDIYTALCYNITPVHRIHDHLTNEVNHWFSSLVFTGTLNSGVPRTRLPRMSTAKGSNDGVRSTQPSPPGVYARSTTSEFLLAVTAIQPENTT